jgi:hypothetical protein
LAALFFFLVFLDCVACLFVELLLVTGISLEQEDVLVDIVSDLVCVVLEHLLPDAETMQFTLVLIEFISLGLNLVLFA